MELGELIEKCVLANAVKYDGKANPGAIVGSVIKEMPSVKSNMDQLSKLIKESVQRINSLSLEEQKQLIMERYPELLEKKQKEERNIFAFFNIKEGDQVITAFPPGPEKYPHIGHAKAALLNYLLAKRYNGKFYLRFEDTNPTLVKKEFYDILVDNFKWLGIEWDLLQKASDYMQLFYESAEKLIMEGRAYMCTCDSDTASENRTKMIPCACRNKSPEENMEEWKHFSKKEAGSMVLRLKIDMAHPNSTMRDPTIFRLIDTPHALLGTKHRVWPNYDFQNSVMDGYFGVTHRIRSKEFEMRSELQRYIQEILGLHQTVTYEMARFNLEGVQSSGRVIREMIEKGELTGWDDPSLTTIVALRRRGFTPEAIREFVINTGISKAESTLTWDDLIVQNRRVLDEKSDRYFFIANPVKISIANAPELEVELHRHPHLRRGGRSLRINEDFYISGDDYAVLKKGELYRFMDAINFIKEENEFVYVGSEYVQFKEGGKKIMHYLPVSDDLVEAEVLMPDKSVIKGLGEPMMMNLKEGDIIQAERFGYMRLDRKEKKKLFFWFTHQ